MFLADLQFFKMDVHFLCTCIPHTHGKNGCTLFRNIPTVFQGGCFIFHGGCAILHKTCIFLLFLQQIINQEFYQPCSVPVCCVSGIVVMPSVSCVVFEVEGLVGVSGKK